MRNPIVPISLAVAVLFSGLIGYNSYQRYMKAESMVAHGARAEATVTLLKKDRCSRSRSRNGHGRSTTEHYTCYLAGYRFQDSSTSTYREVVEVSRETFQSLTEGGTVVVVYNSEDPERNGLLSLYEQKASSGLFKAVIVPSALIFFVCLVMGVAAHYLYESNRKKKP